MHKTIHVHLTPSLVEPDELEGHTVLMIDLLRASTTICYALAAGAREVIPFLEVDDVRRELEQGGGTDRDVVCGGERQGQRIEGFDLGNSPREYIHEVVGGKRVLFTTSNGTRALHHARLARQTIVACLANLSSVLAVVNDVRELHIVCAGSGGRVTREDVIAAGAYVARLISHGMSEVSDAGLLALDAWRQIGVGDGDITLACAEHLATRLAEGRHGKHLVALGYQEDLILCAAIDSLEVAPQVNPGLGTITA